MISKEHRLGVKEFQSTIKKGKGYNSDFFYLKILINSENKIRAGVGVSKKLGNKAVKRNYYKRILKHILKDLLGEKLDSIGYDIVLIARESLKGKDFNYLKKDAQVLFKRTDLL